MTVEELEQEINQRIGSEYDKTVAEATRRSIAGKTFELSDSALLWWFLPDIGDKKDGRVHKRIKGESVGLIDFYHLSIDNGLMYLNLINEQYQLDIIQRGKDDNQPMILSLLSKDGKKLSLTEVLSKKI